MTFRRYLPAAVLALIGFNLTFVSLTAELHAPKTKAAAAYPNTAAIKKAVAAVIPTMPFNVDRGSYPEPLIHNYVNPQANLSSATTSPISMAEFSARWNIMIHRGIGRELVIKPDRLEARFRREHQPCGFLPEQSGTPPFGPASCASLFGRSVGAGGMGPAQVWKLAAGYPQPHEKFRGVMGNPMNRASEGRISFQHEGGITSIFSFSPPPAQLTVGQTYSVSMRGDSVTPRNSPKGAALGMIYLSPWQPATSSNDGRLCCSKRSYSSYYILPPTDPPPPPMPNNWGHDDTLTFKFSPPPSERSFEVWFQAAGYPFVYRYEPVPSSGPGNRDDYYGNATVFVTTPCANIRVDTEMKMTPSGPVRSQRDAINESAVLASKYGKDIMKILMDAIEPVCKPRVRRTTVPGVPEEPIDIDEHVVEENVPPPPTPEPPWPTPDPTRMRKLVTWYNYQTDDSLTFSLEETGRRAAREGYQYIGDSGGFVYADQRQGTVPLRLFYSSQRRDYFTTATSAGESSAITAGYTLVGIEGYIYPSYQVQSVPLKLLWSPSKQDNFTTASTQYETGALASGYALARIEGYVPASASAGGGACGLGRRWDEAEDGWTGVFTRRGESAVFDAAWVSPTGQRATAIMTIGVSGNNVTIRRDQPGIGVCSYTGQIGQDGVTASGIYTCSWWPQGGSTLWRATIRCN